MHTYLKRSDTNYEIGLWLPNGNNSQFSGLLRVTRLRTAIRVVSTLNGGEPFAAELMKEIEEVE